MNAAVTATAARQIGGARWDCHLHKSSNCEIGTLSLASASTMIGRVLGAEGVSNVGVGSGDGSLTVDSDSMPDHRNTLFHVVPVKGTTQFAQRRYNARTETNEFWEQLPPGAWYTPIYYSSTINDLDTFAMIMTLFRDLDRESLSYAQTNKPGDFLKQHIVTDGLGRVTLCNKHLLRQTLRKNGSRPRYLTRSWIRGLLRALFPKISTRRGGVGAANNSIATNTPKWAIDLLNEQHQSHDGRIDAILAT